ncbi:MAG: MlaD family protein [Marmoricola sp.]
MARNKNVRVELTRSDYAKRGLVTLAVVALILGLIFTWTSGMIGGPDTITARLTNAGGSLVKNADVKMRGLIVGRVTSVSRDSAPQCVNGASSAAAENAALVVGGSSAPVNLACVDVTIAMDPGMLSKIPPNVVARILPATVFGTSYVDLKTYGPSAPGSLRSGAVVQADARQGTLELQKALDDIDTLVKVINPAKLDATLTAAAQALDGRGAELGSLIDGLNTLLTRLSPKVPLLRTDLGELAVNLGVLQQAAPALLDGVGDSLGTLQAIATQQASLATLLTGGRTLADQASGFLQGIGPDFTKFVDSAAVIVNTYDLYRTQAFSQAFAALERIAPRVASILMNRFSKQDIVIQSTTPQYYTPADCPTFGSARGDNCGGLRRASVGSMLGGGR